MRTTATIILIFMIILPSGARQTVLHAGPGDLIFHHLPDVWDEGIPLGNGITGVLIWKRGENLRLSLDRSDLWDLRPIGIQNSPEWNYRWVQEQWDRNNYKIVQEKFDKPYNSLPAPTKIPAGALEFDISEFGPVESVHLYLQEAVCEIKWKSGIRFLAFVDADNPAGWYRFEGLPGTTPTYLLPPSYTSEKQVQAKKRGVTRNSLVRLGYPPGKLEHSGNSIRYDQEGWGAFKYHIQVAWSRQNGTQEGCWSVTSDYPGRKQMTDAATVVRTNRNRGWEAALAGHIRHWEKYWSASSVTIPDSILQRQYLLEMYKFGSAARKGAPPISLQAVWTADDGKLPPWKGDFHHDLNTQLSYWPSYKGNHLEEESAFVNWLWNNRPAFERYTKTFFGTDGINAPGVTTLVGEPMGGWIQYSCGPTVGAWLGQHFYLHWKYSADTGFLREKAWPWIRDMAIHLEQLSVKDEDGLRRLPLSSSPEINNNSRKAWFARTTNFDLALVRWNFEKAVEIADLLGKEDEARHWRAVLSEWPDYAISDDEGFMIAPGYPLHESHRHFSHLMAFHPLGLVDWTNGAEDRKIISNTLKNLERQGTEWWTGYSFSWLGNLYARARNGKKAAEALTTFATCFCLPNSFHVNGDQSGTGKSNFTYRPFTLEGNFAFASGIQEMLLQSHTGVAYVFPAVPGSWKDVSFTNLRTEGAFLISAAMENGETSSVKITSVKGGKLLLENPFDGSFKNDGGNYLENGKVLVFQMTPGQKVVLTAR